MATKLSTLNALLVDEKLEGFTDLMVGGSDALARNLNHIENYAIGISKDLEGMTMEGYAYYAKHSQSFEGVSLAF